MISEENSAMELCNDAELPSTSSGSSAFKHIFLKKLVEFNQQHQGSQRKPWTQKRILEVINEINNAKVTMNAGQRRTPMDYYWMNKYDVMNTTKEDYLIIKKRSSAEPSVRIIPREKYFDILSKTHRSCGHGGRDKMLNGIKNRYYIPKKAVEIFVSLCPTCKTKKKLQKKRITTRPTEARDFNMRGQIHLIDFQSCPDGEYKWVLNYQDKTTKFLNIRPLKSKSPLEIATELMKIFLSFGAPRILQSYDGREFTGKVVEELMVMWRECKILRGCPRRPRSQRTVERLNQDVSNLLRSWMKENNSTNWSTGIYFVQYYTNASLHRIIEKSPYKALFGCDPKAGLFESNFPTFFLSTIKGEKQVKNLSEQPTDDILTQSSRNNLKKIKTNSGNNEDAVNVKENVTSAVSQNEATSANKVYKMTKGKSGPSKRSAGKLLNFDHLVFWVANAKTASSYFVTRFGFKPLALREATETQPVVSYAVQLNKVTLVFESPTSSTEDNISKDVATHGDFVKDVAFEVHNLDELVRKAKENGAEVVKEITEEKDENGILRYAVLKTYGDNTHTLIDRSKYSGVFRPGYQAMDDDPVNQLLADTNFLYIDHVEGNMGDGTLEDSVSWYEKNLNMHRFWCVDYNHDLVPYSCINSASVINKDESILLSMNEPAKGLSPTSKATEFVKSFGTSGVEHVALYTDDIISTMRNLKARGAEIVTWPQTYYDIIREKLKDSTVKVAESIDALQENNVLIDFDERGYMLQAFTKHLQARPTLFIEILQRRNHRGFGAMNYKWVFEAIQRMEVVKVVKEENN